MLAVLTSAILFSLAFPNAFLKYGLGFAAWFALVPFFIGCQNLPLSRRIWRGLIFGLVAYGLILQWLWPLHIAGTMLFVLVLCVQPVIFSLFYFHKPQSLLNLFYIPSLWVVSEWLRTVLLNGFCFSLGYSQAFIPQTAQLASLGGSYAVAFVIVWVNYCLSAAVRFPEQRKFYLGLAVIVFAANFCFGTWKTLQDTHLKSSIIVAGIQPDIKPHDKLNPNLYHNNIQTHIALTKQALQNGKADLIVWPETAFPWDVLQDPVWHPRIKQLAMDLQTPLMLGAATFQDEKNFNSAVMIDVNGETKGIYHKNHLVPFCEYCPANKFFRWMKHLSHLADFDFTAGKTQPIFSLGWRARSSAGFGVLICSESCYPSAARRLAKGGADFVVVMLNDGWFQRPEAMMIHAQNAIMRAIETGRDFVSVANTGWTFHADHHGVVSSFLPLQQPQSDIFPIVPRENQTLYARIGDIFAAACLLFVIIVLHLKKDYKNS